MKEISHEAMLRIRRRLSRLYPDKVETLARRFYHLVGRYGVGVNPAGVDGRWSQKDAFLITYADMVQREGEAPLKTLRRFLSARLRGAVSTVHILPFCPWSSDDGFSVIDYRAVEPDYGTWADIGGLGQDFKLMFDLVLNHCSRRSSWFNDYVKGVQPARDYFHELDPGTDVSAVIRPRPTPLLSKVQTRRGVRHVWTTFSEDQVDLNWANPDVLFEFLDILLLYAANGASAIRLDAVAFLWKELGTSCLHLPETHEAVKLIRDVLEVVAPEMIVLTETNVPHEENISYFGDGDEAHMVYQFSLPPLLLHGLLNDETAHLKSWADSLPPPGDGRTFLNFTASHDGVGVRPLTGLVPDGELDALIEQVRARDGEVSWRDNGDGTQSPYELNISWYSAMSEPGNPDLGRRRFLCSQAVAMALQGIPAVYFHNLVACGNWSEGVEESGRKRTINRRKWKEDELEARLADPDGQAAIVLQAMTQMLLRRSEHAAFHPDGDQLVLDLPPGLFGVMRTSPDQSETVVCLFNFQRTPNDVPAVGALHLAPGSEYRDLIQGFSIKVDDETTLSLAPYQAVWLLKI